MGKFRPWDFAAAQRLRPPFGYHFKLAAWGK
jgi:hypothetical protein